MSAPALRAQAPAAGRRPGRGGDRRGTRIADEPRAGHDPGRAHRDAGADPGVLRAARLPGRLGKREKRRRTAARARRQRRRRARPRGLRTGTALAARSRARRSRGDERPARAVRHPAHRSPAAARLPPVVRQGGCRELRSAVELRAHARPPRRRAGNRGGARRKGHLPAHRGAEADAPSLRRPEARARALSCGRRSSRASGDPGRARAQARHERCADSAAARTPRDERRPCRHRRGGIRASTTHPSRQPCAASRRAWGSRATASRAPARSRNSTCRSRSASASCASTSIAAACCCRTCRRSSSS